MNETWLEVAKSLPCGTKTKVRHCGDSPAMLISHSEKGYSCHCFRCEEPSAHKFVSHGMRSIAEIQRHKAELQQHKNKPPHLPDDFTLDIPVQHAWFLKYGISLDVARKYGFGYSEFFHRIIIPIRGRNGLQAVHMRAISPLDKPKYLNLGKPKDNLLFWAGGWNLRHDAKLIIVEDVLSAIKVQLAGYDAVALNGSSITDYQAVLLADYNMPLYIWLDNDKAGVEGAYKAAKQLVFQGADEHLFIVSGHTADPKTYNKEEIASYIEGAIRA